MKTNKILFLLILIFNFIIFSNNSVYCQSIEKDNDLSLLIAELYANEWTGSTEFVDGPSSYTYLITKPMKKILKYGIKAQEKLIPLLKDDKIKIQIIFIL